MDKKTKTLIVAIALALIVAIASTSYAFFTIANKEGNENVITSGTMGLHLEDGPEVRLENAVPGSSVTKTFYVENTGNVDTVYDIYLSEVVNTFVDKTDLVYELTSNDGGYSTTGQVEVPSVSTKIVNSRAISVGGIHHYTLTITFLAKNENQDDNQGKIFSAKIQINEYNGANSGNISTIESCPGCKYAFYESNDYGVSDVLTYGNESNALTNEQLSQLKDNYQDVINESGTNYFLGLKINDTTNKIEKAYACVIENNNPYCLEGTQDGSKYDDNKNILTPIYGNTCEENEIYNGINIYSCNSNFAASSNDGLAVFGYCEVLPNGNAYCMSSLPHSDPTIPPINPGTIYQDNSGASIPELYEGLVPVKYDNNGNTIIADISQEWYDYDNHEWANAVLTTPSARTKIAGQTLSQDEILQYYVWIPRYRYQLWNANNGSSNEQMINIEFEDKETPKSNGGTNGTWLTHPAFTFGETELNGIWVGKFETTGDQSTSSNPTAVTIKPSVYALRNINLSTMFDTAREIDTTYASSYGLDSNEIDTHLMKNMEWGAVAYLSSSIYGRYTSANTCTSGGCEVWINNNFNLTGCGGDNVSATQTSSCNQWTSTNGKHASTTDNQYGIYDMSGGSLEYVMGNMKDSSGNFFSSGAEFSTIPNTKYYDSYAYDANSDISHDRGLLGDATKETLKSFGNEFGGWYGDSSQFPYESRPWRPWISRGGAYYWETRSGIFSFFYDDGDYYSYYSFRVVMTSQDGNY